jgi:hypothetical protein
MSRELVSWSGFRAILNIFGADDAIMKTAQCVFSAEQKTVIIKNVLKGELCRINGFH